MEKFLIYFCDSFIVWAAAYIVGNILLECKKQKYLKNIFTILLFSIILAVFNLYNIEIYHGVIKILCTYMLQILYFKIMFNKSFSMSMVLALTWYLCLFVAEILIAIVASIILLISNTSLGFLKNTILINLLISILVIIIVYRFKKLLLSFIKDNDDKKSNIIIFVTILVAISLLVFRIPVSYWKFDVEFIVTMIILFCFCVVGLYLLKQKSDINETNAKYKQEVKYSKLVSRVTEEYRMINHEHKNQLSIIRGMANSKNKRLLDYIDTLLEKKNDIKYKWVSQIGYIPLDGLKSLINYKLLQMEEMKINLTVIISKEISKTKIKELNIKQQDNLYSIIGVYLDNAMQAAADSRKKQVSINIYQDNKDLVFTIGNTYKGKIDEDKLDEYGYTTKGKNRGVGLHIVKTILDNNSLFSVKRSLVDNYYVQELRVDISKINKTTK